MSNQKNTHSKPIIFHGVLKSMNADRIFMKVANNLDDYYSITTFAETHKELVRVLVRLYIFEQPSPRTLAPSDRFPELTLDVLERDTHTILEESDKAHGKVLVRIPFFFLHIYNATIDKVRNRLGSAFLHDWVGDREWGFFEPSLLSMRCAARIFFSVMAAKQQLLGTSIKEPLGEQRLWVVLSSLRNYQLSRLRTDSQSREG